MAETKRVAFLTNIISPYRKPVFACLGEKDDIELRVYTDAHSEFDREWAVTTQGLSTESTLCFSWTQTETTSGPRSFKQTLTKHLPYGLPLQLAKYKPHTVISLELGFRTALAVLYTSFSSSKLVIWSYQSRVSAHQGGLRKIWRKLLLSRASKVVGMGKQAREVLMQWGVPSSKIVDAPNAADVLTYKEALNSRNSAEKISHIKKTQGKGKKIAIVVGRLVPLKGISHIIEAWNDLPANLRSEWKLVFIGSGPLEPLIAEQNQSEIARTGSIKSEEMPYWYAAADLHIFPTCGDVWGLVVNEAGLCGTPSLCSIHAGCFDDLIEEGQTGYSIDLSNHNEATKRLAYALQSDKLEKIGLASQQIVSKYSPRHMADCFHSAI